MKINFEKHKLTREEAAKWIRYDPMTGDMRRILTIIPRTGQAVKTDTLIRGSNNRGYYWLKVCGYTYLVHRLAVLMITGQHPEGEVDHINGNRKDNRWKNLRVCDAAAQTRNHGVRKDSTSGVRGVTWSKVHNRWVARISDNGVRSCLGYFIEKDDAVTARQKAEKRLGYHKNHGRRGSWAA